MKRTLIVAIAALLSMSAVGSAAIESMELTFVPKDDAINLIYTPADGTVGIDVGANVGLLSTFQISSGEGRIKDPKPVAFAGLFDVYTNEKAFKLDPAGFGDIEVFANVEPLTDANVLLSDFSIDGSFEAGGGLDAMSVNLVVVPEPASVVLMSLGLVSGMLGFRRRS